METVHHGGPGFTSNPFRSRSNYSVARAQVRRTQGLSLHCQVNTAEALIPLIEIGERLGRTSLHPSRARDYCPSPYGLNAVRRGTSPVGQGRVGQPGKLKV